MKVQIEHTRLPRDTRRYLENLCPGVKEVEIDNFNLVLNKYVEFEKNFDVVKYPPKIDGQGFGEGMVLTKKQKYLINAFRSRGYEVVTYKFKPDGRIIVGLGQESVRETSMTLHWIYGVPYIPGQAIKGVISSWIISEGAQSDANFKLIFGEEENKGGVIFMDSFPANKNFCMKRDIMNPHYPDYYTKNEEPADWQAPVPIFFLTLENAVFHIFLVYVEKGMRELKIAGRTLEEWMVEAFRYGGVGAKTSLGYGTGEMSLIGGGGQDV